MADKLAPWPLLVIHKLLLFCLRNLANNLELTSFPICIKSFSSTTMNILVKGKLVDCSTQSKVNVASGQMTLSPFKNPQLLNVSPEMNMNVSTSCLNNQ